MTSTNSTSNSTDNLNILSGDNPLVNPENDALGYAPFAKNLANRICSMSSPEGFVMAVYGAWGSGKSTLLNFVIHYLEQKQDPERPIVVRFNPWWFSGQEDLTKNFFEALQASLDNKLESSGKRLLKRINTFADRVSTIPDWRVKGLTALIGTVWKPKDIYKLKGEIEKLLKKQNKQILIAIDDIDRLTAEEIRQLFRVIKAVANFPNVTYLLLFDKDIVAKSLKEAQGIPGEEYLEKIVQVPFDLPLPNKSSLQRLFFYQLNTILSGTPQDLFDQTEWGNIYFKGIDRFVKTPRNVVRLINILSLTYPAVKGEVNPVDFIAIESLRVFCPRVYDVIRKNPDQFTGSISPGQSSDFQLKSLRSFHDFWTNSLQDDKKEIIKNLVQQLFPKLQAIWNNSYYDYYSWRKELRICSPQVFPIYFYLAVPEGDFSNTEIQAILTLADNPQNFAGKLVELSTQKRPDGITRVRVFLERLEDYTEEEIPEISISSVIEALYKVGDQLLRPEDERRGMSDFGNDMRIGRVVYQLLRRIQDEPKRFQILEDSILKSKSLSTIVLEVVVFGQQQGKHGAKQPNPEDKWIVTKQNLERLENLVLDKIRSAAQQGSLLETPKLSILLYRWQDWGSQEEVKQWVKNVISNNTNLLIFLEKFIGTAFSQSLSDSVARKSYTFSIQSLEPFLDPSQIIDRVKNMADNDTLTENQEIAVIQFIKEYESR